MRPTRLAAVFLATLAACCLPATDAFAAGPRALWRADPAAAARTGASTRPGVHPIEFDPRALADWPVGESGELAVPGGQVYQIRADRVESHPSGNRSWVGKFEVDGRMFVGVLTYGPEGVAGEFRTPEGLLLVTSEGSQVSLVDTAAAGWRTPDIVESDAIVHPESAGAAAQAGIQKPVELKATPSPQTTIDVLIAYTPALVTRAGSTASALVRLDQLIATSNQAYADSEVAITLRLVHAIEVAYTESNDNSTALSNLSGGAGVLGPPSTTLRDRYGADIAVLVRPFNYPAQVSCGIAWIGGYGSNGAGIASQSYSGYAVVSDGSDVNGSGYYCPNAAFPHELGHNMGAMHDRQTVTQGGTVALTTGAYPYGFGYVHNASWSAAQGQNVCNAGSGSSCFGTIMSYLAKPSELKFSNPALSNCPTGATCGSGTENVSLALNNTRTGIASWRSTRVPFTGVRAGATQSAVVNSQFSQVLGVTLRDAAAQVVPGVTVNFQAPVSGASAILSATSVVTDANGNAQVSATANGTAGSYAVTATAASGLVAAPFVFGLTNTPVASPALNVVINGSGGAVAGGAINCPGTCTATPLPGSLVTLTASAGSGAVFTGWLGAGCSGTLQCTVTMDAAKTVNATFAPTGSLPVMLDVDLDDRYDARTDGLLVLRYLYGMTGTALTTGAVAAGGLRMDPVAILGYLNGVAPQLDIDGDGRADAMTDGVMIVRYLFGIRGDALIQGAVANPARRTTALAIEPYLAGLFP